MLTPVFAGLVRDRYCICFIQNDFQQFCFMTATNTIVFWYDATVTVVIISTHAQTPHLLRVQNEFKFFYTSQHNKCYYSSNCCCPLIDWLLFFPNLNKNEFNKQILCIFLKFFLKINDGKFQNNFITEIPILYKQQKDVQKLLPKTINK